MKSLFRPSYHSGQLSEMSLFCGQTFTPPTAMAVGERVRVIPAHIDPTMAMHEVAWLIRGDDVIDRWPIDLRGW